MSDVINTGPFGEPRDRGHGSQAESAGKTAPDGGSRPPNGGGDAPTGAPGPFQKGGPGGPGRPRILGEIRDLARQNAMRAFERLLALVDNGPPAVQIQAAKVVLGAAGVPLAAPSTVRIKDDRPQLPPVALADLLAAVRESRKMAAVTVEAREVPALPSGDAPDVQGKGEP